MPRLQRASDALFIVIFFVLTGGALIQTFYPFLEQPPIVERRKLAEIDNPWPRIFRFDSSIGTDLSAWFDDHHGFRAFFIALKNQVDYIVFNRNSRVDIGKDGYFFLRSHTQRLKKYDMMSDEELKVYKERLLSLRDALLARGIKLIVVDFPVKNDIMQSKLPDGLFHTGDNGALARFRHWLRTLPGVDFLDGHELIPRSVKNDPEHHTPYYRQDVHVNYWGGLPVAKEVVRVIAKHENMPVRPWRKFQIVHVPFPQGTERRFLGLLYLQPEMIDTQADPALIGVDTPLGVWNVSPKYGGASKIAADFDPFDFSYHTREGFNDGMLPTTIVYGNSFSDPFWSCGMHEHFKSIYRARNLAGRLPLMLANMPPNTRFFVFQYFEARFEDAFR